MNRTPRRPAFRPRSESLESRSLMAVFVVTNAESAGPGTLTRAINEANATRGADTIVFRIPAAAPGQAIQVIQSPRQGFPTIEGKVTIDGFTQPFSQPNTSTNPLNNNTQWTIVLQAVTPRPVLTIGPGGSGSEIRGVVFDNPLRNTTEVAGVVINRANLVKIDGDGFTGVETSGLVPAAVSIQGGSFNTVGGDVAGTPALQNVMNSYQSGVLLGAGSKHNAIFGNFIGGRPTTVGPQTFGLNLLPTADNNSLVGNILVGNEFPIFDQGIGNVKQGNLIFA